MKPSCPTCKLVFQRGEEDYWLGGYMVNLVAAELLGVAVVVAFVIATWPTVHWTYLQFGAPVLMIALPFLFFPFSRTLWLAVDLVIRAEEPGDLS